MKALAFWAESGRRMFFFGEITFAGVIRAHDSKLASSMLRLVDLGGGSVTDRDERRYLTFPVVGDAIILAMKTACPWRPLWTEKK